MESFLSAGAIFKTVSLKLARHHGGENTKFMASQEQAKERVLFLFKNHSIRVLITISEACSNLLKLQRFQLSLR